MLLELHITNFAIIDEVHLDFSDGFNIITGETGAGKSILIDAVNAILGANADREFIRSGEDRAMIEAVLRVPDSLQPEIQLLLDEEAIDYTTLDEIHLTREIRSNGRNVARINGSVCKVSTMRDIGGLLVDIHGQSEHLSLLKPGQHIFVLDRFANLEGIRTALSSHVKKVKQVQREMLQLKQDEAALARRAELLAYQIQEIDTARLKPGEDDELREESNRLLNSQRLLDWTSDAARCLFNAEVGRAGAVELLDEASIALTKLARVDASMQELAQLAETVSIQAEELADRVRQYKRKIDVAPGQLDSVEERLALIASLKRKYGGTVESVLAYVESARQELDGISNSEERLEVLGAQEEKLLRQIGEVAQKLSRERQKAAESLSQLVEGELKQLRMEAARFLVQVEQHEAADGCYAGDRRLAFDTTGVDVVEFMLSTNFGEPLKPLAKVASGGETARSMLALKNVLASADHTPTLIFDEIDQGVGGRLGVVLGEKLWQLANHHQVLCITHLAQLASFADIHFKVTKGVVGSRTVTHVKKLDPAGRMLEVAEMLGTRNDSARQNAHDLLTVAHQYKNDYRLKIS